MNQKKKKEPISLKRRILLFMLLCWVVPIVIFCVFTTIFYRDSIMKKTEKLIEDELENVSSYASIRIDDAISLSQRPSYEKIWENVWEEYAAGTLERSDYLQSVNGSLKGKFYLDERFNMYAFYIYGEENPGCFSSRIGITYNSYLDKIQNDVAGIMALDSSYVYVKIIDGRLFIIRNLYTTDNYTRYGTLVLELNKNRVFREVPKDMRDNLLICMGSRETTLDFGRTKSEETDELVESVLEGYGSGASNVLTEKQQKGYNSYLLQKKYDNYDMGVIYWAKRSEIYSSLYEIYAIVVFMLMLFVPVIYYGVYFFREQIQDPISQMMQAAKKMEDGQIGIEVEGAPMPNEEFGYLKDSFDSMSSQVKYLFDYVYGEKMARKDAQIQALQAQINPHFLNNTLEMMNWQARMSGDAVVSKMIESLGTVLDYRMNRANVKEIHLAEELQCTDAYFYIMSMRFGQRLQIEKEIDDTLLYIFVPPLILQPIVENAIVHGVEKAKNGNIRLRIYHDDDNVYLKVYNSGKTLTSEDMERIQGILNGEEDKLPKHQGRHVSIGIRNVNQRIRLVYGEQYGLTIESEEGLVVSTVTLPFVTHDLCESDNEMNQMEEKLKKLQRTKKDKWQE